jgi:ribosomal protein S18 acetylase RimI-like enzyme
LVIRVVIQPLSAADEPLLWEMFYYAIFVPEGSEPPPSQIVRQPELAKYVQGWGRPGDCGMKAVTADGEPVGAAWLRLLTGNEKGYGYVNDATPELSIALLPDDRGQGIGTRLLEHLLVAASEQFDAISLSVSAANPAIHLYRRFGFITVVSEGASYLMKLNLKRTDFIEPAYAAPKR